MVESGALGAGPPRVRPRVALSVVDGRTVRDLFENGFLEGLDARGYDATVFTEAVTVPAFVARWARPWVSFAPLYPCDLSTSRSRAYFMRRRMGRLRSPELSRRFAGWEQRRFYRPRPGYLDLFRRERPVAFLATHAHHVAEGELINAARASGIPTVGLIRSWDNVYKGIRTRPDHLAVWNEINRDEVVRLEAYRPDEVTVIGSPQFDAYFAPDTIRPREKLAERFDLDPARPILLFATQGYFLPGFDERWGMDALVAALPHLPGSPQVICRLHPWSRLEHFIGFQQHPDVRLSYVDRYDPTLTWTMTRDDVVEVANMLAHADVVVTPGSTITLEAAIFDRPTIVPVFHPYQPERAASYWGTYVLSKHFARIESEDLVPIVRRAEDLVPAIAHALEDPSWYRSQRAQLIDDYVPFRDGGSTERLLDLVLERARR